MAKQFGAVLLALGLAASACAPTAPPRDVTPGHAFEGTTMGTTFTVRVVGVQMGASRLKAVRTAVARTLADVDGKMSTYDPSSELSRFNRTTATEPFPMSADTIAVLRQAIEISTVSDGAFDVTVAPLVDAWGFGPSDAPAVPPTEDQIARLRARVGYDKLQVDELTATVRKTDPGLACDLSAIAKGYAVDRVADLLAAEGFEHFLIEVGGEVRAAGTNERGEPWRVGIERPEPGAAAIQRVVGLSNLALATSGDYRNYYEFDGRRVSHTVDPRTGRPVAHRLASVSVLAPLCVRADGLATALEVLGPEAGYRLATDQGWAALFVTREEDGTFSERMTAAFSELVTTSAVE